MSDPREDKLPKWAQSELRSLRRNLDESQRELHQARQGMLGPEDSNTHVRVFGEFQKKTPLEDNAQVEFFLQGPNGDVSRVTVRVDRRHKDCLIINGDDLISVLPQAGNAIQIESQEWRRK